MSLLTLTLDPKIEKYKIEKEKRKLNEKARAQTVHMSQTSFSLYLHNQWTDFHKLSCAGKPLIWGYPHICGMYKNNNK